LTADLALGRPSFPVVPLERNFGHRTITHSFVGLALVALLVSRCCCCTNRSTSGVPGWIWSQLVARYGQRARIDLSGRAQCGWSCLPAGTGAWKSQQAEMILLIALILLTAGSIR